LRFPAASWPQNPARNNVSYSKFQYNCQHVAKLYTLILTSQTHRTEPDTQPMSDSLPATMKGAAIIATANGPTLEIVDVPIPAPGEGEILVRVRASGLNRADLRRAQAHFRVEGPVIAGLEVAGDVVATGAGVAAITLGDRVAAMAPGGYAEFALAEEAAAIEIPDTIDYAEAAALPVWYQTAHDALVTAGGLEAGQSVLVTAAASGIGIAAAQCALALDASLIVGSVRPGPRPPAFRALHWDAVLGASPDDLRTGVLEATGGRGVDVVVDMVGAGILDTLLDATALGGRIVSVGRLGGFHASVDMDKLALRRISLIGVTFRTRDREQKRAVRDAMVRDLMPDIEAGRLRPIIDSSFPLADVLAAQQKMAENRHFGKIVLTTD